MSPYVIAVADGAFADRDGLQADFAGEATLRWIDLSRPEAIPALTEDADAVVVTLQRLTPEVISAFAPSVRVIGRAGVGLDTIDLGTAESAGVAVINQPAYGAQEVASHALALLLAVHRRLLTSDSFVRAGWSGRLDLSEVRPLDETTLGVLGFGRIGRTFAEYARPLVGEVIYYDPAPVDAPSFARAAGSLEGLLTQSEALSLHLPLVPETRGLLGRPELNLLPTGAMVVNVARGGILDEEALGEMLASGRLAGAGLDVFEQEPFAPEYPLLSAPNTVLTPHSASSSTRAVHRLSHWTIEDMIEYLNTGGVQHGTIVVVPRAGVHRR